MYVSIERIRDRHTRYHEALNAFHDETNQTTFADLQNAYTELVENIEQFKTGAADSFHGALSENITGFLF